VEPPVVLGLMDPYRLAADERVELVEVIERAKSRLDANQVRAIEAVASAYEAKGMVASEARHEIGAALRFSPMTAADRVQVAVDLVRRFPRTLALLDDGTIPYLSAAHLARGVDDLSDESAELVEDAVLPRLPRSTPAEARRAVADAVVRVDPAAAKDRAERRKQHRRIERVPDRDGLTGWLVPMTVADEGLAWARATELATKVRAAREAAGLDDPGLDALRVDVVVDLVLGVEPDDLVVDAVDVRRERSSTRLARCSCGGKQVAAVVLDVATLFGMVDNPGVVPGYGTVPAAVAREMAADRNLVRWLVAPDTGELLDVGAEVYEPSPRLQRFIRARDQRCGFPGCGRPAAPTDLDHVRNFGPAPGDGKTVRANLGPLCRQHHNAKTHGHWQLLYDPLTGLKSWTSPLGRTYEKAATPIRT
jgi:Domain of unknown function (DUF222)